MMAQLPTEQKEEPGVKVLGVKVHAEVFIPLFVTIVIVIVWVISRRKQRPQSKQTNATPDFRDLISTSLLTQGSQNTLYIKSNDAAFDVACKYFDCAIVERTCLAAIVMNVGGNSNASSQLVVIKVASEQGGFIVPATTLKSNGSTLLPGDLVYWMAIRFEMTLVVG
jgi:hypothetical protein